MDALDDVSSIHSSFVTRVSIILMLLSFASLLCTFHLQHIVLS